jgi:MFS family permease
MMFLQFFVWGAWFVTVGNYMGSQPHLKDHIYWAYTVGPIAAIISPFFLGMVADRFFATERVLGTMHLLGGAAMLAVPTVAATENPLFFVLILLLHTLCYMPTLGLTNTLAFHHVGEVGNMTPIVTVLGGLTGWVLGFSFSEAIAVRIVATLLGLGAGHLYGTMLAKGESGKGQEGVFPLLRVYGTFGWIVAGVLVSRILHGDTSPVQFYVTGGAAIALGLYSFALPHTPAPSAGKQATAHDILGLDALALLKQPSFAVFVFSSFLICIPLAAYYSFAPVFVSDLGLADPGFKMSFGQMSEIFFMLVMPLCFARLGVKSMLLIGMLAWVTRYGLFAGAAEAKTMWMVMGGILLHGICYDFFFVTGFIYVDRKAPAAIRGQAQGFLVLVTQGLGMLIGAQVAGRLVARYTVDGAEKWQTIWLVPCIAAGAIMLLFLALFHEREDTAPQETEAELAAS